MRNPGFDGGEGRNIVVGPSGGAGEREKVYSPRYNSTAVKMDSVTVQCVWKTIIRLGLGKKADII